MEKKSTAKAALSPQNEPDCNATAAKTTTLTNSSTKFELGKVVATRGAVRKITELEMFTALRRHSRGDWGEVCEQDRKENEFSLNKKLRLFSVYRTAKGEKFWIITEADRSSSTVLLPEEY